MTMTARIDIITVEAERELDRRFFINLPVHQVVSLQEYFKPQPHMAKIEIPQSLARFINDLNKENERLRAQLEQKTKHLKEIASNY